MNLTNFILNLIQTGKVTVPAELHSVNKNDEDKCAQVLLEYYTRDCMEQAGTAPTFSTGAALWAAKYFFHATQLAVIRSADAQVIENYLQPFGSQKTAGNMFSVHLTFRYLPSLLLLAKGLAPADILVTHLQRAAAEWPLTAPGIELCEEVNINLLENDCFLWQIFIDGVIDNKDRKLVQNKKIADGVAAILGGHGHLLWPGFENIITT